MRAVCVTFSYDSHKNMCRRFEHPTLRLEHITLEQLLLILKRVLQVQKGYYCEFCNIPFTTITKVNLHVAEATHIQNKGAVIVKRIGNFVVALNDVCINKKAWNGFIGDVCALCNLEFFDENIHKTEQNHVLNLIQRRVVFVDKTAVYRMVSFQSRYLLS